MRKACHVEYKENDLVLKSVAKCNIKVKMHLTLPPCMMPSFWIQHHLDVTDVESILDAMSTRDVWLLAIATGSCEPSLSHLIMTFQSLQSIGMDGKATALRKILAKFQPCLENTKWKWQGVTTKPIIKFDLSPLPMLQQFVCNKDMEFLRNHMLSRLTLFETIAISGMFHFLNRDWIAITLCGDYLQAVRVDYMHAVRVVPEEEWQKRQTYQTTAPLPAPRVSFQGKLFYLFLDDSMLFCPGFV